MPKRPNIVTCLAQGTPFDDGYYPLVATLGRAQRRDAYWKSVVTFFATSLRQNPDAHHIACTNVEKIPEISGLDVGAFLSGLGVEIVRLPFGFRPPEGISRNFGNTFFRFDTMKFLGSMQDRDRVSILLDCDCIWLKNAGPIVDDVCDNGLQVFDYFYSPPVDRKIHNFSRLDLGRLFRCIDPEFPVEAPLWLGADILSGTADHFAALVNEADRAHQALGGCGPDDIPRLPNGHTIFDNDEYMISFACAKLGVHEGRARTYLERVWTSLFYRTVRDSNMDLTVWHLPHEKTQGLPRLYKKVIDKGSPFWTLPPGPDLTEYLGAFFGIPRMSAMRVLSEFFAAARKAVLMRCRKSLKSVRGNLDMIAPKTTN